MHSEKDNNIEEEKNNIEENNELDIEEIQEEVQNIIQKEIEIFDHDTEDDIIDDNMQISIEDDHGDLADTEDEDEKEEEEDEEEVKLLGEGTYGRVNQVFYKKRPCAVKINMYHEYTKWKGIVNLIEYDILKRTSKHPLFLNMYKVCNNNSKIIEKINENNEKMKGIYNRDDQIYDNIHFILELGKCSLSDYLEEKELNMDEVAKIICDILLGIEFLHLNGIIHRDLKCSNVIIFEDVENDDVVAKICDFGMSKYFTDQDKNCDNVATYTMRSPELVMGDKYGTASDIWMVGCILYEILFDMTPIDLDTKKNSKGEKVYKFDVRKALISIFKYSHHNINIDNINRILQSLELKPVSKIKRITIRETVNTKLTDDIFYHTYTKENLIQLLECMLEFDQEKRLNAEQILKLPFFSSDELQEYIEIVRKYKIKMDMLGRDLKITKCDMRNILYNKIKNKYKNRESKDIYSTRERIDIHTIITFERWIRALHKAGINLDKKEEEFENYYLIVRGVMEKLFNEGGKANSSYINKLTDYIEENGEEKFIELEEELVLDILDFPYEITPYEIAAEKGIKIKGEFFNQMIDVMSKYPGDVMDMNEVVNIASKNIKKKSDNKKRTIPPKVKNRIARNRR